MSEQERPEVATNVSAEAEAWADAAAAEAEASVATRAPVQIVRELLRRKGNELDLAAQRLRDERQRIDRELDELDQRRDAINTAFGFPDDVLEVFETRRGERVAAAEYLLTAYREMGVAGAHLGKVPGIPDRPLRHEIQRVAAQVLNVIGNLAPGLLEALEADAAGGTIPPMSDDHEVRRDLSVELGYAPADRPPHDAQTEDR